MCICTRLEINQFTSANAVEDNFELLDPPVDVDVPVTTFVLLRASLNVEFPMDFIERICFT